MFFEVIAYNQQKGYILIKWYISYFEFWCHPLLGCRPVRSAPQHPNSDATARAY